MPLSIAPNYRNLPQFLTSVGVLLIALGVLSHLFLLTYLDKEFLVAVNDAHKLNVSWDGKFPENSPQQLIHLYRVREIEGFQKRVYVISYFFIVLGFVSTIIGLYKWIPLQKKENELLDLTIRKTKLEIKKYKK